MVSSFSIIKLKVDLNLQIFIKKLLMKFYLPTSYIGIQWNTKKLRNIFFTMSFPTDPTTQLFILSKEH